jgi:hypothetical protein
MFENVWKKHFIAFIHITMHLSCYILRHPACTCARIRAHARTRILHLHLHCTRNPVPVRTPAACALTLAPTPAGMSMLAYMSCPYRDPHAHTHICAHPLVHPVHLLSPMTCPPQITFILPVHTAAQLLLDMASGSSSPPFRSSKL